MVQDSTSSAPRPTEIPALGIFQRRGLAVNVGAVGVTLTPAVKAIIDATERPFRAQVRINN